MNRVDEIVAEVRGKGHVWDAHDQGRWAQALGTPRDDNPHYHPALGYHINVGEWYRGWDAEDKRK